MADLRVKLSRWGVMIVRGVTEGEEEERRRRGGKGRQGREERLRCVNGWLGCAGGIIVE